MYHIVFLILNILKDPTIEKDVFVSLEEIMTGVEKKMKISRKVVGADGLGMRSEDKVTGHSTRQG